MPLNSAKSKPTASQVAWRLLHLEPDDVDALKVRLTLRDELPAESSLDHVSDWESALERLSDFAYDAIVVGLGATDQQSLAELQYFTEEINDTPVIVLSNDEDMRSAVIAGRSGASAYLLKSDLTGPRLCGALRQAFEHPAYDGTLPERRKEPRYPLEASAVIYPIEFDGSPGREIAATTVDVSEGGIVVLAEQDSDLVPDVCLLGVECLDGRYRYTTVEWRHRRLALPAIRFGGRFLRRSEDPFHPTRLSPRFDAQELRFVCDMEASVLQEWVSRGILQPREIDRVLSCPKCCSLPTFRRGCPKCGSANTEESRLIHHFACANVAPADEYTGDLLTCPKCCKSNLVVGADFEYLNGPSLCCDCDWSEGELEQIAECLKCGHRFLGEEAIEREVYEYYVDRLDPLALIDRT